MILLLAIAQHLPVVGQVKEPRYEFGLSLGRIVYQGDLTPSALGSFRSSKFSYGLTAARVLSTALSVRASFLHGGLSGNDGLYSVPEYRKQRNFNFTSTVNELTAQLVWSVPGVPVYQKGFSAYLFAGGGAAHMSIRPNASGFNAEFFGSEAAAIQQGLDADSAHGLPGIVPLLIAGGGVKYFFTPSWAINAEASYRLSNSDYMDGFSESVNPELNDHYMNYSVGVIYRRSKRNSGTDCPMVRY